MTILLSQMSTITSASQPSAVCSTLQAVVGDRLDLVRQRVPRRVERLAPGRRPSARASPTLHLEAAEQQVLGVEAVQQLPQPVEQQVLAVVRRRCSTSMRCAGATVPRSSTMAENRACGRLGEQRVEVRARTRSPRSAVCSKVSYMPRCYRAGEVGGREDTADGEGFGARRGSRAVRPTRPAGPNTSFGRRRPVAHRRRAAALDFAPRHAPGETLPGFRQGRQVACREVLATRKPTVLLSLDGRFVLRLAERTFNA